MGGIHGAISLIEAKPKAARGGRRFEEISAGNYAPSSSRRACPEVAMDGVVRPQSIAKLGAPFAD